MAAPVEQQPVDEAAELEIAAAQAIEACGGDLVQTIKALIVANGMLEQELSDVYAKASRGFLRGRRVARRKDSSPAEKAEPAQKKPNSA
ncbi:hypothetical protein IQ16_03595 [Bradyrhizobium huanghuaihaiense]|uniref:Uncharacterized protein n=1 Tax=Bradyrhizobium huanghuaihaiense TaxID=990078 RepID=A0A562RN05_9BRAD|nr:hypothetical protein [Bradyrhizobium huanghuaihaiense]TWI70422.1 hypothetical protein IQ16_03595 [Bradyrhizobium huanghuaihaiense]